MKKRVLLSRMFLLFALLAVAACGADKGLVVHYDFEGGDEATVKDVAGGGEARLMDGARLRSEGGYAVMDLGAAGWLDMGEDVGGTIRSLGDFTVATYLYIYPDADLKAYGNFVWAFSTHEACGETTGEYSAFRVNAQRYEQSTGGYTNEIVGIQTGTPAEKGRWIHIAYTQGGGTGRLYIDGVETISGPASISPRDLTVPTRYNWLGKAPFRGDVNLKAAYHDFRIYDRRMEVKELKKLSKKTTELNNSITE